MSAVCGIWYCPFWHVYWHRKYDIYRMVQRRIAKAVVRSCQAGWRDYLQASRDWWGNIYKLISLWWSTFTSWYCCDVSHLQANIIVVGHIYKLIFLWWVKFTSWYYCGGSHLQAVIIVVSHFQGRAYLISITTATIGGSVLFSSRCTFFENKYAK